MRDARWALPTESIFNGFRFTLQNLIVEQQIKAVTAHISTKSATTIYDIVHRLKFVTNNLNI